MGGKRQTARVTHFYARTVLLNDRFDEDIIIMYIFFFRLGQVYRRHKTYNNNNTI